MNNLLRRYYFSGSELLSRANLKCLFVTKLNNSRYFVIFSRYFNMLKQEDHKSDTSMDEVYFIAVLVNPFYVRWEFNSYAF